MYCILHRCAIIFDRRQQIWLRVVFSRSDSLTNYISTIAIKIQLIFETVKLEIGNYSINKDLFIILLDV